MKTRNFFLILSVILFLSLNSCQKEIPVGKFQKGQVALTFDDNNINNWYNYLPLLDSLQIHVTFYVCRYHTLTQEQINKLKVIESHGNEIAFHTTNHKDMARLAEEKNLADVMYDEVYNDLNLMIKDGFHPQNFAYPFGSHTDQLDIALLRVFKSVRAASNKNDWRQCLTGHWSHGQVLHGAEIDECSPLTNDGLITLLEEAASHHDCAVLTAHDINKPHHRYQITAERLKFLVKEASQRGLEFVRVSDIAQ